MSRRAEIAMSTDEALALLESERVVTCATNGPRGLPHLMPLWYVVRDGRIWAWTFAKSQKVRNLERDPRATLQVEVGDDRYDQLRGLMLECDVTLHRNPEVVASLGRQIAARYAAPRDAPAPAQLPEAALTMIDHQARKRVALEFVERRRASWDHRKLEGTY